MSISLAFFVFLNAFGVSLFLAFPLSITAETSQEGVEYRAAPKTIHWKRLFKLAAGFAAAFTLFLALVMKSGMVQL